MNIQTNTDHSCPLCGAQSKYQTVKCETVYGGTSHEKFYKCSSCDVIYLYPIPLEEEDMRFYENEFNSFMIKRSQDDKWTSPEIHFNKLQQREMPLRVPWLKKYAKMGHRVLEVGSSTGFVLALLKEWGCDCTGIEVNKEHAEYARELGLNIYQSIDKLSGTFDLLLHYYVLEHMSRPEDFLHEYLNKLAPGGKMLFEVPNGNDPLDSLYHVPAFNSFYWYRGHHWYFTPKSLNYLLDKVGFSYEIHPGQRYDISNHIHWMLEGRPGGMGKYDNIFSEETKHLYAEDLKRSGHFDYLIAIITK